MTSNAENCSGKAKLIANLHFLARNPKYDTVKPYTVRFNTEGKFPYTNIENVKHDVELANLRPILGDISWNQHGFQVIKIPERMTYEDLNNDETVRTQHIPHILTTLQSELNARHIHVLDMRVSRAAAVSVFGTDAIYLDTKAGRQFSSPLWSGLRLLAAIVQSSSR